MTPEENQEDVPSPVRVYLNDGGMTVHLFYEGHPDHVTDTNIIDVTLYAVGDASGKSSGSVGEDCDAECTSRPEIDVSGTEFKDLVSNCYDTGDACPAKYNVPIGCWDTSKVTDMSFAFSYKVSFNNSINCWNVGSVTTMSNMFFNEQPNAFNQPLNNWDVASVSDMNQMFHSATNFNQPLNNWNVVSVTGMGAMFKNAPNFNQPLDDWNVASVKNMIGTFSYTTAFNQPLNDWNMASVDNMIGMFGKATNFNQCLSSWADKTPPNVNVGNIFLSSGCPDQSADVNVGPWCQGEDEQCDAPSLCWNWSEAYEGKYISASLYACGDDTKKVDRAEAEMACIMCGSDCFGITTDGNGNWDIRIEGPLIDSTNDETSYLKVSCDASTESAQSELVEETNTSTSSTDVQTTTSSANTARHPPVAEME